MEDAPASNNLEIASPKLLHFLGTFTEVKLLNSTEVYFRSKNTEIDLFFWIYW